MSPAGCSTTCVTSPRRCVAWDTTSRCSPRPIARSRCLTSTSPSPAARYRSRTTARWPACSSARSPRPAGGAGCGGGPSASAPCPGRRWRREGHFDVVHVHEPASPSISLLVCMIAKGPIVATFHAAKVRSVWLAALGPVAPPRMEKIGGRIAVSDFARWLQVEHLGGDAVIIPNGVHVDAFSSGPALAGSPRGVDGPTIGFLGRYDEPRKGLPVLLEAMRTVVRRHPGARLLIVGRGDADDLRDLIAE